MKFFNIILGSLVGLSTFSVSPAFAGSMTCEKTSTNWDFCYEDSGNLGTDILTLSNPNGDEITKMEVVCTGGGGNRWESYGNFSKEENQWLANHWCKSI